MMRTADHNPVTMIGRAERQSRITHLPQRRQPPQGRISVTTRPAAGKAGIDGGRPAPGAHPERGAGAAHHRPLHDVQERSHPEDRTITAIVEDCLDYVNWSAAELPIGCPCRRSAARRTPSTIV